MFKCSVPSWWNNLGTVRRCGLARGGVPLEVDLEVSKAHAIPHSAVCLWIRCKLSAAAQCLPAFLLPHPPPCHDGPGLPTPDTVSKPPDGTLPFKVALVAFVTAIEK